jgi:DnaJ-class molecular chaperone
MEFKDYYKILEVPRDASQDDIRKAYRKLARKYHPDVSKEPDAEARMRDLNEANDVLRDAEKRAAYDGLAGLSSQARKAMGLTRLSFKTLWRAYLNRPSNSAALKGGVKVLTQVKVMRNRYAAKITMPI